jgi:uncharacterized protein YjbJ (UPF0337 family)
MKFDHVVRRVAKKGYQLLFSASLLMVLGLVWNGTFLETSLSAIAGPYNSHPGKTATYPYQNDSDDAFQGLKDNTKDTIDRVAGSGNADRIEGEAKRNLGRFQRTTDRASDQARSNAKQLEADTKQNVDRAKNAFERLGDRIGDASQKAVDSVKDAIDD